MADATSGSQQTGARAAPQRPLSPHLGIWRFTATMAASITHRATGMALYAGTLLLAIWLCAAALGDAAFEHVKAIYTSPVGLIVLVGYTWALFFHLGNGVRHLFWDVGVGFSPKTASNTAWGLYGLSLLAAAGLWIVALS